jgi:hypothetical protein
VVVLFFDHKFHTLSLTLTKLAVGFGSRSNPTFLKKGFTPSNRKGCYNIGSPVPYGFSDQDDLCIYERYITPVFLGCKH